MWIGYGNMTVSNRLSRGRTTSSKNSLEKKPRSTYLVSFLQQELSEVRAILARNTRHQSYFSFFRHRYRSCCHCNFQIWGNAFTDFVKGFYEPNDFSLKWLPLHARTNVEARFMFVWVFCPLSSYSLRKYMVLVHSSQMCVRITNVVVSNQ
jgi:hypothetical protein